MAAGLRLLADVDRPRELVVLRFWNRPWWRLATRGVETVVALRELDTWDAEVPLVAIRLKPAWQITSRY
jgi:hypothetical protein